MSLWVLSLHEGVYEKNILVSKSKPVGIYTTEDEALKEAITREGMYKLYKSKDNKIWICSSNYSHESPVEYKEYKKFARINGFVDPTYIMQERMFGGIYYTITKTKFLESKVKIFDVGNTMDEFKCSDCLKVSEIKLSKILVVPEVEVCDNCSG